MEKNYLCLSIGVFSQYCLIPGAKVTSTIRNKVSERATMPHVLICKTLDSMLKEQK